MRKFSTTRKSLSMAKLLHLVIFFPVRYNPYMKYLLMGLLIGGFIFALIIRLKCAAPFGRQDEVDYVRWGHLSPYQIRLLTQFLFMYFMPPFSFIAVPAAIYLAVRAIIGYKNGTPRQKPRDDDNVIDVEYREL